MANIDDLVTVQKNGVVAVNALTQALEQFRAIYASAVGTATFLGATENSLVYSGSGRLVNVIVSAAAAGGTIHDAASVSAANTTNIIFPIPNTVGLNIVNVPFFDGLVIKPAASSTVGLTYSEG
jgi:hypothetical protein